MNAKRLIKNTKVPKSRRYCPKCDDITTFGYNYLIKHSGCQNCGHTGQGIIFLTWCNPRLINNEELKQKKPTNLPRRVIQLIKKHKLNKTLLENRKI